MGEGDVKKSGNIANVFYGWSLPRHFHPLNRKICKKKFDKLRKLGSAKENCQNCKKTPYF